MNGHAVDHAVDHAVGHAVGIDIGGTKIAAGVVDLATGTVSTALVEPTRPERGGEAVLDDVLAIAGHLRAWCSVNASSEGWLGVGVGVPELVDPAGTIRSAFQFDWRHLRADDAFTGYGPAVFASDVRAAALAEARFGTARDTRSALYVSVGTGISSCLLLDGQPWPGTHGNALVMATGPTTAVDPSTGHTVTHILEEIASGPALVQRYQAASGVRVAGAEDVLARADAGDATARRITKSAAHLLGNAIGHLVNVLDPEIVVTGGGLGCADGPFRHETVRAARATIWADASRDVPIEPAALGANAGMIGAALTLAATVEATRTPMQQGVTR